MAENVEAKGTQANADTTQAKPVDQTAQGATQGPNAEWQVKRLKRQNDDLKARLAVMEEASKSAEQKAREDTERNIREEVETHYKAQMTTDQIRSEIRLKLVESGIPANQVAVILEETKPETPEEAIAAATAYIDRWKTEIVKPQATVRPIGQFGAPTQNAGGKPLTLKDVQRMSREEYTSRHAEIMEGIESGRIA